MNEDKLNEKAWEYSDSMKEDETTKNDDMATAHYKGFKQGARWHESLPLAERLTEEEKEYIRERYIYHGRREERDHQKCLQEIFGSNLFTPTEQ